MKIEAPKPIKAAAAWQGIKAADYGLYRDAVLLIELGTRATGALWELWGLDGAK